MKLLLQWIENILITAFIIILPFEKRHIFFAISPVIASHGGHFFNPFAYISVYLSDFLVAIFTILLIARFKLKQVPNSYKSVLFLLFLFALTESLILPHETFIVFYTVKIGEFILLALYFSTIFSQKRAIILNSLVISGLFQSFLAMTQFKLQHSLGLKILGEQILSQSAVGVAKLSNGFIRAYGTFAHPNQLGAFLFVACATATYLFITGSKNKMRIFYGICIFLLVDALILTFSRNAYVSLTAVIIILVSLMVPLVTNKISRDTKRVVLNLAGIFAITLLVAYATLLPYINSRITISDQVQRINFDTAGLKIFLKHPIFGVGIGQMVQQTYNELGRTAQRYLAQPPHNFYIDVAVEMGMIGLLLYLFLFSSLINGLWQNLSQKQTENEHKKGDSILFFSIFIGILISMLFDHFFYTQEQTQLLLWSIIGIIIGLQNQKTAKNSSQVNPAIKFNPTIKS